jgi:mannose-6-phosphate isomerase-like protein (cupin superfamily)
MKQLMAIVPLFAASLLGAQAPMPPAVIMSNARLVAVGDSLAPAATKTAQMGRGAGYTYAVTHRDSSGSVEVHADWADVFIIQSGSASLLTGGLAEGGKEQTPGEWRGGSIRGGTRAAVHAGDIVVIPAGTPHVMMLNAGEKVNYITFKVARGSP